VHKLKHVGVVGARPTCSLIAFIVIVSRLWVWLFRWRLYAGTQSLRPV